MAVHIRLSRAGAKKAPFYRIVVTNSRSPRDGRFIENIGTFDPSAKAAGATGGENGVLKLDAERLAYWQKNGATASATVAGILKKHAKAAAAAAPAS